MKSVLRLFPNSPRDFGLSISVGLLFAVALALIGTFLQFSVPHSIALTLTSVCLTVVTLILLGSVLRAHLDPIVAIPGEVIRVLEERLPETRFVDGKDETLDAMLSVVRGATTFILATGSRSRKVEYLQEIEEKMRAARGIIYHRIVFGRQMKPQLCSHLCRLLGDPMTSRRTNIAWIDQADLGYFTVTDAGVIIFMPDPFDPSGDITRCLHVAGRAHEGNRPLIIEALHRWITQLWGRADQQLDSAHKVMSRCENRKGQVHQEHA